MKKQINPTIKAHLLRSAFYILLLLAACAIPFALAQRNTDKQTVKKVAVKHTTAKPKSVFAGARPPASMVTNQPARATNHFSKAPRLHRPQGDCGIIVND